MPFEMEVSDLISVASIIIATVFGFLFYKKGLQRKHLSYAIRIKTLVFRSRDYPSELRILYSGREIEQLIRYTIYIWNTGNQPIRRSDLNTSSPLRIAICGVKTVLQSSIAAQSRTSNNVNLSDLEPQFDYLNVGDGFVLDIFVEAESVAETKIKLKGEVIGANRQPKEERGVLYDGGITLLMVFYFLSMSLASIFMMRFFSLWGRGLIEIAIVAGIMSVLTFIASTYFFARALLKRIPPHLILREKANDWRARWKLLLFGE